jgi:hypothetical protein
VSGADEQARDDNAFDARFVAEIRSIWQELGFTGSGSQSTVGSRLDALDRARRCTNDGT